MNEILITFIASFLIWLMFAGLFVLWIIDGRVKKEQAIHALASTLFAWLISQMIKGLLDTKRPFITNGKDPMTITTPQDAAFPSGHSTAAFALATSVWLHDKRLGTIYLLAALLVALGRIFANVHYPIDTIVGALIGTLSSVSLKKVHLYELLEGKK